MLYIGSIGIMGMIVLNDINDLEQTIVPSIPILKGSMISVDCRWLNGAWW